IVEEAAGRWETVSDLTARAEPAVAANMGTPCALNAWSLLACALARVHLRDEQKALNLEQSAADLGMEGYGYVFDPLHVKIAIAQGDLAEVEMKLGEWSPSIRGYRDVEGLVARLNALVALERRAEIEEEAPDHVKRGTY